HGVLARGLPDPAPALSKIRMGTKNQVLVLTALASLTAAAPPGPAEYPHPRGYVSVRASSAPSIDGRLDDPAWRDAAWSDDFVDMADPSAAPAPRTRLKMIWDDQRLYIGAEIADPHVWAEMTVHDSPLYQE